MVATVVKRALPNRGVKFESPSVKLALQGGDVQRYRIAAGKQLRGKRNLQLVPEFNLEFRLKVTEQKVASVKAAMNSKKHLNSAVWVGGASLQRGLKVLEISGQGVDQRP